MPAINLAYLEFRLSGGAANANPAASLGGIMSSQRIFSKSATGVSNITGITIDDAPGTANGAGTLAFTASTKSFTWTPNGGTAGASTAVTEDCRIAVPGSTGWLFLTVDFSALPAGNQSDTITVAAISNALFDDISKSESYDGAVDYRCMYAYNAHDTDPFIGAKIYILSDASGADSMQMGLDLAGTGDGSSTGVADTIADDNTAPDPAVSFSAPTGIGSALSLGRLEAGEARAIWQKRTVPAQTLVSTPNDTFVINVNTGF
jgi:hypothetical protein